MKKLFLLGIATLSLNALASDNFMYMNVRSYSDNGGITKNKLFKVKAPNKELEEMVTCTFTETYTENGEVQEAEAALTASFANVADYYMAEITYVEIEDGYESYSSSSDYSENLNDLFASFTMGDGYVSGGLQVGSKDKVINLIKLQEQMEGRVEVDYENIVDVTYKSHTVNEQVGTAESSLTVQCEFETM